jgi:hypothetical protein
MVTMKKFLIIGNVNAISYKEMFPLIAKKEVFVRTSKGTNHMGMWFYTNSGELKEAPSVWFTTLDSKHLYKTLELTKTYDPAKYPRYDNYDAIEVSCIKGIPKDYDGVMGVPISIVLFSPEQFELIWTTDRGGDGMMEDLKILPFDKSWDSAWINGQKVYKRILIKRR